MQNRNAAIGTNEPVAASATQTETPRTDAAETLDPSFVDRIKKENWRGDFDGLLERHYIRALVLYNKTNFLYDGPQPRGITYDALKEFEKFLNEKLKYYVAYQMVAETAAKRRPSKRL